MVVVSLAVKCSRTHILATPPAVVFRRCYTTSSITMSMTHVREGRRSGVGGRGGEKSGGVHLVIHSTLCTLSARTTVTVVSEQLSHM